MRDRYRENGGAVHCDCSAMFHAVEQRAALSRMEDSRSLSNNCGVDVVRRLFSIVGVIMLNSGPDMIEFIATVRR